MSSYYKKTKNPYTGEWEDASWLDNYFGPRQYGVLFKDGSIYNPDKVKLETRDEVS